MSKRLIVVMAVVLVGMGAGNVFALSGNPVVLYRFDGDPCDSRNAVDGMVVGDPNYLGGVFGQMINLDADDRVDLGIKTEFNIQQAITISAWVNLTGTASHTVVGGNSQWKLSIGGGFNGLRFSKPA